VNLDVLVGRAEAGLADELDVVGMDADNEALAVEQPAQCAAHDVDDPLGLDLQGSGDDLLGDRQRELGGARLGALGELVAQHARRLGGLLERRHGGGELGGRRLAAQTQSFGASLLDGLRAQRVGLGARLLDEVVGGGGGIFGRGRGELFERGERHRAGRHLSLRASRHRCPCR
jgi:hypothetical protein